MVFNYRISDESIIFNVNFFDKDRHILQLHWKCRIQYWLQNMQTYVAFVMNKRLTNLTNL